MLTAVISDHDANIHLFGALPDPDPDCHQNCTDQFWGTPDPSEEFHQKWFRTFGVILLTRNDYTQTDRQTDRHTALHNHHASARSAADTVNPRIEAPGFYQYNLP